jgi:hypothetical protein
MDCDTLNPFTTPPFYVWCSGSFKKPEKWTTVTATNEAAVDSFFYLHHLRSASGSSGMRRIDLGGGGGSGNYTQPSQIDDSLIENILEWAHYVS